MLLPDRKTTPGLAVPMSTKKVCGTKWGKDERHVTESMKKQVCAAYGQTGCPNRTNFEIDHLVSRELGGADDLPNLWPQPAPQFHMKDVLENHLHRQVCSGKMTLSEAQREISTDWYAAYLKMQKEAAGN
ncbi:MAG: HNH endonuclease [Candidatus Acidiferrales bacterium]